MELLSERGKIDDETRDCVLHVVFYALCHLTFSDVLPHCPTGHVESSHAFGKTTSGPLVIDERILVEEVRVEGPPPSTTRTLNPLCGTKY